MYNLDLAQLTERQRAMVALWNEHLGAEFQNHDADAACNTMVAEPHVNHVPVLTGGVGRRQLEHFYSTYFVRQLPVDTEMVPVARIGGQDHIVDEFIFRFTHTLQ